MLSDRHIVNTDVNFLASASYLIIQLLSRITNHKSPLELLYHQIPDYNFLKTFGYACWAHLSPYSSHKPDLQSKQCVFLGYSLHHKGYKCLDLSTNRVYISCNVVFDEKSFPFATLSTSHNSHHSSNLQVLSLICLPPILLQNYLSHFNLLSPIPHLIILKLSCLTP